MYVCICIYIYMYVCMYIYIYIIKYGLYLIVGIDKEIYGFHKKRTRINSIVIVSAKKLKINLLVQLYQC